MVTKDNIIKELKISHAEEIAKLQFRIKELKDENHKLQCQVDDYEKDN